MTFPLRVIHAGGVIDDVANGGEALLRDLLGAYYGETLGDINDWRRGSKRVHLIVKEIPRVDYDFLNQISISGLCDCVWAQYRQQK